MFRANTNNQYLFSKTFYDDDVLHQDEDYSVLEHLLSKYLKNETIEIKDLHGVIDDMMNWKPVEQYHYTPFVLLIMRYSMMNTYSRI